MMGKIASDATLLRRIKAEQNALKETLSEMRVERDSFRARATKAEQETAEWKARFDILLRRDGMSA
jgi:FtsZ-binding cell division protein ZapB